MDDRARAEIRKQRRILLPLDVDCYTDAGSFQRRSSDLSAGGIFIDSLTILPPNSLLKIRFCLPDSNEPIETSARVLYVRENIGAGLQFLGIRPADRSRIEKLIDRVGETRTTASGEPVISKRVLVDLPVNLTLTGSNGSSTQCRATIESLAQHGARIRTDQPLEANMTITVSLPDGAGMEAKVIWEYKGEAGIHAQGLARALGVHFPQD